MMLFETDARRVLPGYVVVWCDESLVLYCQMLIVRVPIVLPATAHMYPPYLFQAEMICETSPMARIPLVNTKQRSSHERRVS